MDQSELEQMSVKDLCALKDRVDDAIRAEIAKQRLAREQVTIKPSEEAVQLIDLERERDAWAARRKVG